MRNTQGEKGTLAFGVSAVGPVSLILAQGGLAHAGNEDDWDKAGDQPHRCSNERKLRWKRLSLGRAVRLPPLTVPASG